jgi:CubicO group peptidase (beta-lactamase class C family)
MNLSTLRTSFWGGWGGSLVVNDLDASMTYAYVMNKMSDTTTGDSRAGRALLATFQAIAN